MHHRDGIGDQQSVGSTAPGGLKGSGKQEVLIPYNIHLPSLGAVQGSSVIYKCP